MTAWLPQSLFGRLLLILASGLIVAQLLSAALNLAERDSTLLRVSGMQPAQRIADIVKVLDSSSPTERERIVAILNVPPWSISLGGTAPPDDSASIGGPHAAMFSTVLRAALGDDRQIRVTMSGTPPRRTPPMNRAFGQGPMINAMGPQAMHRFPPEGMAIMAQVRLTDGTWVTFDTRLAPESAGLPWRLLLTLLVLLVAVLMLSYVAVRWVARPLHTLASAADELGRDIKRPPLPEDGPTEVSRAARAFNTMQSRLVRLIEDRTRLLAAMSHDLKTPITRMRLRADLMDDGELRGKFEADLREMEAMVAQTLEFLRGIDAHEPSQPVDLMSLLESLQADNEEMGRSVTLSGRLMKPYVGVPQLLKRCISNLIENAIAYGTRADIRVEEGPRGIVIAIRDHGPGISEKDLDRVFEPFVRLEGSRNRTTGGTGLGLGIARDIARAHGGDVQLRNHERGGLEAVLTLPYREIHPAAPTPTIGAA